MRLGRSQILYDRSRARHIDAAWFDPACWPDAPRAPGRGGRGRTLFIAPAGREWVLRPYRRGGLVARVLDDEFLWTGAERTRAFREWRLLAWLHSAGFPVPAPVAARYRRSGLVYRADLLTERLPGVEPLSLRLSNGRLDAACWAAIGATIARFHRAGVFHADLNAHNIQVDDDGAIYLLDFDRGRRRRPAAAWQRANLARLERSLRKVSRDATAGFDDPGWAALRAGYADALAAGT